MPITLNGNGTVTGISVGGLPDGTVDADMLAADSVTAPKIGSKTFTSYAIIADRKTASTLGGTFTYGDWRTRDLNTEISDVDDIVSISNDQFTLQAGTYLIKAQAPAYDVNRHQIRLYNATDSTVVEYGMGQYTNTSDAVQTVDHLVTRFTISGAKAFEIQHRCQTSHSNDGFGVKQGSQWTVPYEQFTTVEIYKEA